MPDFSKKGAFGMSNGSTLQLADAINELCPWSGKPIEEGSLTVWNGVVVGFCNPGCRDKFERAQTHFAAALSQRDAAPAS
jgi:hypothetical protein